MGTDTPLQCVMPWKALFMDECDGRVAALPCCLSWIRRDYGTVGTAPLEELWNSEGAQEIRRLIASGRQEEVCDTHCPYWMSGRYGESALRIVDGPPEFVANQETNLAEIRERRTVLRSRPMLLKVLPTLRCNIRCSMCFQDHYGSVDIGENFWAEIDQLLPVSHEITFQGGEVTLDRHFRQFLTSESLRAHPHVRINLITNGTVLDKELSDALNAVRMNYVIVSVNAATRDTYTRVAKKDLFDRVIGNLRGWIELADQHPCERFSVYASFVVMRSNFRELPQFIRLAEGMGAEVQLLNVIGDREGEDIFVRRDEHEALRIVLDEASGSAHKSTKEQVERIRKVLESHQVDTEGEGR
jgi:molybdenum cofactor biosynthesis enzyme MoaA